MYYDTFLMLSSFKGPPYQNKNMHETSCLLESYHASRKGSRCFERLVQTRQTRRLLGNCQQCVSSCTRRRASSGETHRLLDGRLYCNRHRLSRRMSSGAPAHRADNTRQFGHAPDKSTGVSNDTNADRAEIGATRMPPRIMRY